MMRLKCKIYGGYLLKIVWGILHYTLIPLQNYRVFVI